MRKRLLLLLALLISVSSFAQEKYTLSGTITEAANGETAFGASVYIKGTYIGTITNEYGFYSNVNPLVSHPRWSQKRERRIGEFTKRDTLMFNGYSKFVSNLYSGMDLKKKF